MKYQAYAEYKDSGVEWLGVVPNSWISTRLKFEALINMGQSPNSDDCNQDGFGLPFLQGNAEFGDRSPSPKQYCDIPRKIATEGQLLFSVRAPVGALNIADQKYGIGRGLCAIASNERIASDFLWWLIPVVKSELNSVSTGSTFEAVSAEQVENVVFFRPSIFEQEKIANFLDHETAKIDILIEKQQQLIKLLKEKRQAVISHAVTKGLNPNAPMRDSGVEWLGEVPEHWKICCIKHVVSPEKDSMVDGPFGSSVNTDMDYVDEGVPVIRTINITNIGFSSDNLKFMRPVKFDQLKRHAVYPDDVLFSKVGTIGNSCTLPQSIPEAILSTTGSCKITVDSNKYIAQFLVLCVQLMYQDLMLIANSNVQPFLNMAAIKNLKIPLPSLDEQSNILIVLNVQANKIDNVISKALVSESILKERRSALISAAVTGKIDVRHWNGVSA